MPAKRIAIGAHRGAEAAELTVIGGIEQAGQGHKETGDKIHFLTPFFGAASLRVRRDERLFGDNGFYRFNGLLNGGDVTYFLHADRWAGGLQFQHQFAAALSHIDEGQPVIDGSKLVQREGHNFRVRHQQTPDE